MLTITESTGCLECGYTVLIQDYEMGELVCTNCGTAFSIKPSNKKTVRSKLSNLNALEMLARASKQYVNKTNFQALIPDYIPLQDYNARAYITPHDEKAILKLKRYLKTKKRFTESDAAKFIGLSSKWTLHLLTIMRDKGWISKQGITPWGEWKWNQ